MPVNTKKYPTDSDAIKALLDERGLKSYWIAQQLGVLPQDFSRMKNGIKPFPPECVGQLAEILGISVDRIAELFALDGRYNYAEP